MGSRRPLPTPPAPPTGYAYSQYTLSRPSDMYSPTNPYYPYYPSPDVYSQPTTTLPGGTLLHKGFYDLLSMIPTPASPSRLLQQWTGTTQSPDHDTVVAGPRYEQIAAGPSPINVAAQSPPLSPVGRKGRRISKDMVSKPTGFVYVTGLQIMKAAFRANILCPSVIWYTRRTRIKPRRYSLGGVLTA